MPPPELWGPATWTLFHVLAEKVNENIYPRIVGQLFDVIKQKNMYGKQVRGIERSTFLINDKGVLVQEWRKVKVPNHVVEMLDFLKAM